MRAIKLRLYTDSDGTPQICDANTGIPVEGVASVEVIADPHGAYVTLNMCRGATLVDVVGDVSVVNVPGDDTQPTTRTDAEKCPDCRGTGQYQGLDTVDDCSSCGGIGYV